MKSQHHWAQKSPDGVSNSDPCFTKEQENEAEHLKPSPSGSELLPKDHRHLHGVSCDPSARPDASVHPLPPHVTMGANRLVCMGTW